MFSPGYPGTSGVPSSDCCYQDRVLSPWPISRFFFLLFFSSGELRSSPGLQQLLKVQVNAAATLLGSALSSGCSGILRFPSPAASDLCPDAWCVGACPNALPPLLLLLLLRSCLSWRLSS